MAIAIRQEAANISQANSSVDAVPAYLLLLL
jgi:hypothetical protein